MRIEYKKLMTEYICRVGYVGEKYERRRKSVRKNGNAATGCRGCLRGKVSKEQQAIREAQKMGHPTDSY